MQRSVAILAVLAFCSAGRASDGGRADVEHVRVTHEGVAVRASVVPAGASLAHTAQIFPTGEAGQIVGGSDAAGQVEQALKNLDAVLGKAGASRKSLARVNLYAASTAAAGDAARTLGDAVPCAVSVVVTPLPMAGALVALDAVAVATLDASPDPAVVRLLKSDRAAYVSGMAAEGDMAEATRLTLEQLDGVLKQLGATKKDVVHVKSFLRGAADVTAPRAALARFFDDAPPPAAWVEWTMKGPIEIELVAQLPAKQGEPGAADTVSYRTPPGVKASPVYSKVALVHGGRLIYTSGVSAGPATPDAAAETRLALAALRAAVEKAGGDFGHLVKATYYPATDASSAALNQVRPEFFDPKRPPAASKAPVGAPADPDSQLTMDLIAVTPK